MEGYVICCGAIPLTKVWIAGNQIAIENVHTSLELTRSKIS